MDSLSTLVVSAAKLLILNPNEFDLWKMRIEQYFLMTYYSMWEVIIIGDSPAPTVVIDGAVRPVTILSADQKLARRNELKARDVNLKFLRSLPSELKTHTLIKRNKADLEEHSLDDLFNSLRIYKVEVKHSSTPGNPTQNLVFVSSSNTDSTTDSVSAATSAFAIYAQLPVSSHPNIDSLSNAVIFSFFSSQSTSPQLDDEDLKQIDVDDLEEIDLRWQMAMLTIRARRFLQKTGRNLGDNRVTTMGFDMSKVECYNCHRKGHFVRECRSPKDTRRTGAAEPQKRNALVETSTSNALVSQCDGIRSYDWSYQAEEQPANFALMAITSSSSSSNNEVQSCSKACSKAYDQLHSQYDKLTVEFLKSQIDVLSYQAGLKSVEARLVVYKQNESILQENINMLKNKVEARDNVLVTLKQKLNQAEKERDDLKLKIQPSGGYHVVLPPITGTFMPPKPDLVFHTAPIAVETDHSAFTVQLTPQIAPSFVQFTEQVKPPRNSVQPVKTSIPAATPKPTSPKSNRSGKRKNRKTCFVCKSVDHLIKDYDYHAKKKAQHTPRNYAHMGNHKQNASFTQKHPQKHIVHAVVLTKSKPLFNTAVRPVSAAMPNIMVTRPRLSHSPLTKSKSPIRRHITRSPSLKTSNSPPKVIAVKAPVISDA
nr:hypothetical protein [Tanacetum cinerariifolium]